MMTSSCVSAHDLLIDNPFPGIQLVTPTDHDHGHGGHYCHNWISHHNRQLHHHQDQQVGSDDGILNQVMDAEKGVDQARAWEHSDDHLYDPRIGSADVAKKMNPKRASTSNPTMPVVEMSTDEFPYFLPAENNSTSINSGSNANNNNNIGIRVCSDCNTTKTPLWRSGPKGPKSLCNACGIRQRKARRALAAAVAADSSDNNALTKATTSSPKSLKIKTSNINNINKKIKTSSTVGHDDNTDQQWQQPYKKRLKKSDDQYTSISHDSNPSSDKDGEDHRSGKRNDSKRICFEEFITRSLSKNAALHRVFPQDEKEAAILLMALSCGLVHN